MRRALLALTLLTALPAAARADGADLDPAVVRGRLTPTTLRSPDVRCNLGRAYVGVDDARAAVYLAGCATPEAEALVTAVERRLLKTGYVRVEISAPPGVWVTLDGTPTDEVLAPSTVWQLPGPHRYLADAGGGLMQNDLVLEAGSPGSVVFAAPTGAAPTTEAIDFGEEKGPTDNGIAGPPPKIPHASLLPERYNKKGPTGELLVDTAADLGPGPARVDLGVRAGAALQVASGLAARPGVTVGVSAAPRLRSRWRVEASLDMTFVPDDTDALRLGARGGRALLVRPAFELAALLGGRADLLLGDTVDDRMAPRASVGLAGGVRVGLGRTRRLALELMLDQGVTELAAGARGRGIALALSGNLPVR